MKRLHQAPLDLRPFDSPLPVTQAERVVARVSLKAIESNFEILADAVKDQWLLPMIKSNGYGHGAVAIARTLLGHERLYAFGVATLEEGRALRESFKGARTSPIVVFSGAMPWREEKGQFCERFGLTPVIASEEDWQRFTAQKWPARIRYELEFNTGMNRLGLGLGYISKIKKFISDSPILEHPSGIFTHLAMSEAPENALTRQQVEGYRKLYAELRPVAKRTEFHIANSAAIWNWKAFAALGVESSVVRPGLSLYGVRPWKEAPERGLRAAMEVQAQVLQVHTLKRGDQVGYSGTYRVAEGPMRVATLGIGYADGLLRILGGQKGKVLWGDQVCRILGRISMDLCATLAPQGLKPGDWVQVLGPGIDPWEQALEAQTIPYELLTSVSERVKRVHDTSGRN